MRYALSREEELLKKIEEWQRKANDEADPFNNYISVFIAYNIFYNLYAKKRVEISTLTIHKETAKEPQT